MGIILALLVHRNNRKESGDYYFLQLLLLMEKHMEHEIATTSFSMALGFCQEIRRLHPKLLNPQNLSRTP